MKKIVPANSAKQLKLFVDFPHDLYKNDSNYVPELFIAQRDLLTPGKHPFHENGEIQKFLAYDEDKIVGRIAAIINKNHNKYYNSNDGFFGFFDCIDDSETARLLFDEAAKWLKDKGVTGKIIGPVNPSTNEPCGLQTEGFDSPSKIMMTYNAPYYQHLVEENGFTKQTDILAYQFLKATYNDTRMRRLHDLMQKRLHDRNITIRKINMKDFKNEAAKIKGVYNSAWDKNLGFSPLTDTEFAYMAKDMKLVLDPDYCVVAEHEGKIIGFALALPNINETLIKVKRGRLFPTGIFKLLTGKNKVKSLRILLLGVVEGYRKAGIEMNFYSTIIDNVVKSNRIEEVEASWILEDNLLMRKAIEDINGKIYKRYRIYEKQI
ncbi:hypothetical protein A9P82_14980 [Arachidicoccus ginsenosidimutans]|uniref:hypothetical protein n=1 Tax=Arachidicoccus sp. BS20 TaxID=1850526 RepID=UPI0007F17516|nr:hypothetical protein [Arachidicoccus sp. BS20]ANI90475.1 hypothetical protein A9P82_14980 [Arachidicoccus sp. BS20]